MLRIWSALFEKWLDWNYIQERLEIITFLSLLFSLLGNNATVVELQMHWGHAILRISELTWKCHCILSSGAANIPTATGNDFASSSFQTHSRPVTTEHSSLSSVGARGAAVERTQPPRNTVPPTPPTKDRPRPEPYRDRSSNRCTVQFDLYISAYL